MYAPRATFSHLVNDVLTIRENPAHANSKAANDANALSKAWDAACRKTAGLAHYDLIYSPLAHVGYHLSDTTIGNILNARYMALTSCLS